jgi:hypothetical protein
MLPKVEMVRYEGRLNLQVRPHPPVASGERCHLVSKEKDRMEKDDLWPLTSIRPWARKAYSSSGNQRNSSVKSRSEFNWNKTSYILFPNGRTEPNKRLCWPHSLSAVAGMAISRLAASLASRRDKVAREQVSRDPISY